MHENHKKLKMEFETYLCHFTALILVFVTSVGSCSIILMLSWAQLALFTTTEFCCASPHPIFYCRVWVETFLKNLLVNSDTSFLILVNGIKPCRYILIQFLVAELTVQESLSYNYHYCKCFKCFIVMCKLEL